MIGGTTRVAVSQNTRRRPFPSRSARTEAIPMNRSLRFPLATGAATAVLALALQGPAQAHNAASTGALAGAMHPLLGLDHLAMLLTVGAAGALLSPALLLWALGGGVLGALLGAAGLQLPGLELLAAAAVLALGLWTLLARRLAGEGQVGLQTLQRTSGAVVAAAVMVHALLHGLEAPRDAGSLAWWAGALLASIAISGGTTLLLRRLPVAASLTASLQGNRRPSR